MEILQTIGKEFSQILDYRSPRDPVGHSIKKIYKNILVKEMHSKNTLVKKMHSKNTLVLESNFVLN